jgi:hypothetical protein
MLSDIARHQSMWRLSWVSAISESASLAQFEAVWQGQYTAHSAVGDTTTAIITDNEGYDHDC